MDDENKPAEIMINASEECVEGVVATMQKKRRADFTVTAVRLAGFFEYENDPPMFDE